MIYCIERFLNIKKYCTSIQFTVKIFKKLIIDKKSECGLPNDHFGRLTSVTLVLITKNKLGSAQVPKFGRLLVKIDSSASIP